MLDEPTANLDPAATAELFQIIRGLAADRRHTILIIEHKLDEVIDWVDSVLVLDGEGRLLYRGDPRTAFYDRREELAAAGVWRPQTVELVAGLRAAGWQVPGRPLSEAETAEALRATPGLLGRLRGAGPARRRRSRRERCFRGPAGGDRPSSRSAISASPTATATGPWTASRSRSIGRSSSPSRGPTAPARPPSARCCRACSRLPGGRCSSKDAMRPDLPAWAVADRVGYVFQNPEHQFVADTVRGELAFSLSPKGRGRPGHLSPEQERLVDEWLERLDLLKLAEANPFSLSQGQKRRLSVAAMLIRGCPVLILDEPTLGQDAVAVLPADGDDGRVPEGRRHGGDDHSRHAASSRTTRAGSWCSGAEECCTRATRPVCSRGRTSSAPRGCRYRRWPRWGCCSRGRKAPDGRFLTARGLLEAAGRADGRAAEPPPAGERADMAAPSTASYLGRRNPTIKFGAVLAAAVPLTFVFDPVTPFGTVRPGTLVAGRLLGGLSLKAQLRPLAVFVLAGIAILLANIFFNKQNATSEVVFSLGAMHVTGAALWAAASLWVRLLCFALLSLVFVRTTQPQHLLLSLVHQLHLSDKVAYGVMVGYRMLPVFQADYDTIRAAQRLRGVREGSAFLHPVARLRRYALPLLTGAIRQGGQDRHRHGCPGLRGPAPPDLPGKDGGDRRGLGVPGRGDRGGGRAW